MNRRHFLSVASRWALAVAGGYSLVQIGNAYRCEVTRQDVVLSGLPPAFEGFRVALLSDFHHSEWIPASTIRAAVNLTNSLQPDLIALTGDYIHRGREWVGGVVAELGRLRARHGVVAVLGNHDHYGAGSSAATRDALRQVGIENLTNRGVALGLDGQSLWVGGVGDLWTERQKINRALAGALWPQSALLLSHNPDYAEELRDDRVGLVLSGHTHGGQCVLPLLGAPILPSKYGQKYRSGLCPAPATQVFVTKGIGSSLPLRINCLPEVALLTLCRKPAQT